MTLTLYPSLNTSETFELRNMQEQLNAIRTHLHYGSWPPVLTNGMPSEEFTEAVTLFQQAMYMKPTGVLDTDTRQRIEDLYRWALRAGKAGTGKTGIDYKPVLTPSYERLGSQSYTTSAGGSSGEYSRSAPAGSNIHSSSVCPFERLTSSLADRGMATLGRLATMANTGMSQLDNLVAMASSGMNRLSSMADTGMNKLNGLGDMVSSDKNPIDKITTLASSMGGVSKLMRSLIPLLLALLASATTARAQSQSDILSYIDTYRQTALDQEKQFGVPASITLAQGILESGAGKSGLTRNSNNHFGIKAMGGWTGNIYQAWDDEPQKSKFRVYADAAESFRDHSRFLKENGRYAALFQKSVYDYRGWAIGLQKAGYATAPNYAAALIGFIDTYRLYAINGGVKLRAGKTVVVTRQATDTGKATFDASCQADEDELSEEEETVAAAVKRYVVDINDVRCTILYPGMTLSSIAMKYDIPKQKLLEYNETASETDIREGDIVFLDKKKTKFTGARDYHIVKAGDTLYGISQEYGIRLSSLEKMNRLNIFSQLHEGDRIQLK